MAPKTGLPALMRQNLLGRFQEIQITWTFPRKGVWSWGICISIKHPGFDLINIKNAWSKVLQVKKPSTESKLILVTHRRTWDWDPTCGPGQLGTRRFLKREISGQPGFVAHQQSLVLVYPVCGAGKPKCWAPFKTPHLALWARRPTRAEGLCKCGFVFW